MQVDGLEGVAELVAEEIEEGAADKQPELPGEEQYLTPQPAYHDVL